jgi:hypothetical protein
MKKSLVLLCLWTYCAAAQEGSQIVGRWRSQQTSKGGIGAMYDFEADGTVRFSPGAIVPMQYRVEGDRLKFFPSDGIAYALSWNDDDHLRMTVNGAGSEDYTRLGVRPDPLNKLAGEWIGTREMGGQKVLAHWIFSDNSNAVLMIRFFTQTGNYTIQNGRLVAKFGEQVGLDGPISFYEGVLTINRSRGRVTKLSRY